LPLSRRRRARRSAVAGVKAAKRSMRPARAIGQAEQRDRFEVSVTAFPASSPARSDPASIEPRDLGRESRDLRLRGADVGRSESRGNCGRRGMLEYGVAFLSWNQHPEPNGSRPATPLLPFQHPSGHPRSGNEPLSGELAAPFIRTQVSSNQRRNRVFYFLHRRARRVAIRARDAASGFRRARIALVLVRELAGGDLGGTLL
jgi:hypothetical protein